MNPVVPGYIIERPLGRGRTGEVWRALKESDASAVAIRRILPALAAQPGVTAALKALKGECSVLRATTVTPIADVIEHDRDVFVVEPFVEGKPLSEVLAKGAMEPEDVHALAMDVMDALADLHRQRVVHGDVRPSNVLLTSRGAVLVGVGIAHRTKRRKTSASFLLRDPYDAPEMDKGVASHLSDIYAVGALLMHASTGEEGPYYFLSETDAVMDELLRAMSPAPEHRHGNIEGLRLAFTDAEKKRGPVKQRESAPAPPVAPPAQAVPWPEEDDVSTRADFPSVRGFPQPKQAPEPRKVELLEPRTEAVSARKEGTVAPGERFEEAMDRVRGIAPIAGAVAGGLVVLLLFALLWPESPDDMAYVELERSAFGDPQGQTDEQPGFSAPVAPFWLDRVEVTAASYRACIDADKCTPTALAMPDDPLPMTGLTWLQAQSYCSWRDKRLPTENEWEAAARSSGRYPWGDSSPSCDRARYGVLEGAPCAAHDGTAGPVPGPDIEEMEEDTFAHLAGNVWEFVDADHQPERGPGTGGATIAGQSALRVIKGGAWSAGPEHLRPAARIGVRTDYAAEDVGFRCARSDE